MASSEEDNTTRSVKVEATFEYKRKDQIKSNWDNPKQAAGSDALVYKGFFKGLLNETIEIAIKRYQIVSGERGEEISKEIKRNLQVLSSDSNKHPNLIRYFGHATDENFRYVATELCKCSVVDIVQYLAKKSEGPNSLPQVGKLFEKISSSLSSKEIFRQSLEAVSFLHGLEMIHRNLHPNNFLISCIDPNKDYFLVKLTDFHLSKRLENNSVENTGTFNKKGWFAPESADKNSKLTNKVDSFILGLYYFYILSGGKHPFGKGVDAVQIPGIKNPNHSVYKPKWDGKPDLTIDAVYGQEEAKRALQMIKDLIKYNPGERKSVDDVLKSSYFQLEPYNIYDHPSSPIPGLCVIICQDKFHNPKSDLDYKLDYSDNRHEGIGLDARKLEETFKSFGYDILSFKNLRAAQIENLLSSRKLESLANKAKKSLKNYASFIVCLLGHGDKGVLKGVDGVPVSLNIIQYDAFNDQACPDLKGKPKIFIVLACQGNKQQSIQNERSNPSASSMDDKFMDEPFVDEEQSLAPINRPPNAVQEGLPPVYDFIRLVSTIEEYQSRFNYGTGSVFIQSLCNALRNEYNEVVTNPELIDKNKRDLTQLFTELVIPIVGRSGGKIKQTPEFRSSLVKTIKFRRQQQNHGTLLQREYNGATDDESFIYARRYREILLNNYAKKKIGYEYLLKTVYGEAFQEPEDVQRAIAWVIFNRYKKLYRPEWGGKNMRIVCMATDQFKCWMNKEDIIMTNTTARNAIERWLPTAFDGGSLLDDPTGGSIYFNKPAVEGVMVHLIQTVNIGSYQFYKDP